MIILTGFCLKFCETELVDTVKSNNNDSNTDNKKTVMNNNDV